jgi:hypothetical protein
MKMVNSRQMFYTISSSILMVYLFFPLYNIKGQGGNGEEKSDPLTIFQILEIC